MPVLLARNANNTTHQVGTDPRTFEEIWQFETSANSSTTNTFATAGGARTARTALGCGRAVRRVSSR